MDAQIKHFTDKIIDIGNHICDNWVPHHLAWQGFQTMVWQSLKYPLAACSLTTKTQGKTLTTQLYNFFLPKTWHQTILSSCILPLMQMLPCPQSFNIL
jgi:hypothetical protein